MTSRTRIITGIFILIAGVLSLEIAELAQAQTSSIWSEATNVSRSGGASQLAFTVSPDGIMHALWWDSQDGERYARTVDAAATTWTPSLTLPDVYGKRVENVETGRTSYTPPRDVQLASNALGEVFGFWFNIDNQLMAATARSGAWNNEGPLMQAILAIDTWSDPGGALHLAAARSSDEGQQPAGLYYLVNRSGRWSAPRLVYASPYFRTLKPQDVHLNVAGNAQGAVLMAWDDPSLGQSLYARSEDGGATWSTPQSIAGVQGAAATHAHVTAVPSGEFLMLWQEPGTGGCGYVQSRSVDGGLTWTAPEKVLSGLTQCEQTWSFSLDSTGALWLMVHAEGNAETGRNRVSLAKWDGSRWSDPIDISLTFFDLGTGRTIILNCLRVAVAGNTAGLSGCDSIGDVWAARNAVTLDQIIALARPVWSPVIGLSDGSVSVSEDDAPALIADTQGNFQALWSQDLAGGTGSNELYGATWESGRWSRPVAVARAGGRSASDKSYAAEPALAIDDRDRVHAVWSPGTNGSIQYSSAYARDFTLPQAWASPVSLSMPDGLTSWPDIAVDPRGELVYVAFAVPFNEKRGIYLVRSQNSGTTWMTPTVVFDAAAAGWSNVDKPRLAWDASGNILHAAWLRPIPAGGVGSQEIYYARSTDQGRTWSSPTKMAEGNVDWPRLVVPDTGQAYLAWTVAANIREANSATPLKVRGQFSPDGGQRWSPGSDIPGFEQVSGPIGLAPGGAGQLYLAAIGKGVGEEAVLLNARWNGQTWEMREPLSLGQPAAAGNAAVAAANPAKQQLMVAVRMHTLDEQQIDHTGLSSTERQVEAAQLIPMPAFTPAPTTEPTARPTATPQPTPRPAINAGANLPAIGTSGSNPLAAGGMLAAIIVVAVFAVVVWRQRRRHG